MGFINRLKTSLGFKAAVSAPVEAQRVGGYGLFVPQVGRISPREAWGLYKSVGTFAKTVDLIADQVASLHPVVKINGEIVEDPRIQYLLSKPGLNRTRRRFIKEVAVQYLSTGTAYIHAMGNVKSIPVALDIFKTKDSNTIEDGDGWPMAIEIHEGRQSFRFERQMTPGANFRYFNGPFGEAISVYDMDGDTKGVGLPRLQAVQDDVNLKMQGLMHNRALLGNGARLSGALTFKNALTPDTKADIRRDLQSSMSGASNAGKIAVFGGGEAEFVNMMQSNRDMDWLNLMNVVDTAIVDRYNVPSTLFTADAQTYNNYKQAWQVLYDNAVLPCFEVIYTAIARTLSDRMGVEVEIVHDVLTNNILADLAAERAKGLLSAQMITVNEARDMIGMEPLVGGDNVMGPAGLVPQFEDIFTEYGIEMNPPDKTQAADAAKSPRLKIAA